MKVIDSDNYSASGIETLFFPGGEPHARVPKDFGDALLFLKARTWNDLGIGCAVLDALQAQFVAQKPKGRVWVFAAYFPGARQDRTDGQTGETNALVYSMLDQVADEIFTFDIHSDRTHASNLTNFTLVDLVKAHRAKTGVPGPEPQKNYWVIAPDKGAHDRASQIAEYMGVPLLQCEKTRDFATGKLTGLTLPPLPGAGQYMIVDDICDGGWTFNLIAEAFQRDPLSEKSWLALWVSHGIFSKGLDAINPKIDEIGTTDSWCQDLADKRLDVISLQPLIDKIVESAHV